MLIADAKRELTAMQTATTRLVSPVRPPASIPAVDSTTVVVFDVPNTAPTDVAQESQSRARSSLVLNPPLSTDESSSSVNRPLRLPVPMNVPMVSKVSTRLNERIATRADGIIAVSENSDGSPSDVKITPNVSGSCPTASMKDTGSVAPVRPSGIPTRVVTTRATTMDPRTFLMYRTMARTRPNRNSNTAGSANDARAGVPPSNAMAPTCIRPM